ncbi:transcriptional regulator, TetR family [Enhydrobacter aerosaccus]|uniref:Transcriptional regulator, TetR family n=1 Tax=Enhydrobacter aerosaccus TaxID=225324 RepID=A0A1T4TG21_9HYPH|nr:TetR/AcrR family transcriptional regulator [Enhydrobacter aerosaccus]SKA39406.1 transcriptional regulator, TetR family [Enhydrobacter aerosaccus]
MDEALDKAIRVFREQGYNATSITDLGTAMGLAAGSLYKAFKDKRAIYLAALERYQMLRAEQIRRLAETPRSGRARLCDLLSFYVDSARGIEGKRGCLAIGGAVELSILDPEVAALVRRNLARIESQLADLIRQGQADGSISRSVDSAETARVMLCLLQGLRVVGRAGRPPDDPAATVAIAMKLIA